MVPADMQERGAPGGVVERTVQVYGPIEILVNNAGVYYSEAGALIYGGMGAFAVSKYALRVLTELIQEENQALGIKAWAICPGYVDTPMASSSEGINVENILTAGDVAEIVRFLLRQGDNVKMGPEILVRTIRDPHARTEKSG